MRRMIGAAAIGIAGIVGVAAVSDAADQEKDGWKGAPRTFLWNSGPIQFTETAKFKKSTVDDCGGECLHIECVGGGLAALAPIRRGPAQGRHQAAHRHRCQ